MRFHQVRITLPDEFLFQVDVIALGREPQAIGRNSRGHE